MSRLQIDRQAHAWTERNGRSRDQPETDVPCVLKEYKDRPSTAVLEPLHVLQEYEVLVIKQVT